MLKISEATSLALHSVIFIVENEDRQVSLKEIVSALHVSEAHLSKVLQRLCKAGFLRSIRGPKGGFKLDRPAGDISLLNIYEAIEGPLTQKSCLLKFSVCGGQNCIFGNLLTKISDETKKYLSERKVSEWAKKGA